MGKKIIGKNVIGGVTAADNGIKKKEQQAIKYLQTIAQKYKPLFLAYSGGKDSEVTMHIARKAGIEFTPFYNSTTIDQPGTINYVKSKDVMIIRPRRSFFELIRHRGLPSTFQRFCCAKLKERFVAHYVITGVRRSESKKRADRYKEPETCRIYKTGQRGINFMPILYWTNEDVEEYIKKEHIQCHPLYYDEDGKFHVERRLGCMACPLRNDRGKADFMRYPRLVKAWCSALAEYRNTRPRLQKSLTYFENEYENFYCNVILKSIHELRRLKQEQTTFDAREELSRIFNIELPEPKASLKDIEKRLGNQ